MQLIEVESSIVAKKQKPGQFIVLRGHQDGERIPLIITESNNEKGTISMIFKKVGETSICNHYGSCS